MDSEQDQISTFHIENSISETSKISKNEFLINKILKLYL